MPEIIDAHIHIGRYHLPIEEIDSLLKASGISRAVVGGVGDAISGGYLLLDDGKLLLGRFER